MGSMVERDPAAELKAENARLIALLEANGIQWRMQQTDVRIIDFVDMGHPGLLRMWEKRQRGYKAMGYRIGNDLSSVTLFESDEFRMKMPEMEMAPSHKK